MAEESVVVLLLVHPLAAVNRPHANVDVIKIADAGGQLLRRDLAVAPHHDAIATGDATIVETNAVMIGGTIGEMTEKMTEESVTKKPTADESKRKKTGKVPNTERRSETAHGTKKRKRTRT